MIFFIYGTDQFRVNKKLQEIKEEFSKKRDKNQLNAVEIDGKDLDIDLLRKEAMTVPFLGDKKMIIIKNAIRGRKNFDHFLDFLKNNQAKIENSLVFVENIPAEKNKLPQNKLFTFLKKQEYVWELNLLKPYQLKKWLASETTKNKLKIDSEAIEELIKTIGNDLYQIDNELKKLKSCGSDKITKKVVQENVKANFSDKIFELVDAISQKNQKKSIELINNQLKAGSNPISILNMIIRQFKIIIKVKDNPSKNPGLHPFVFKKAVQQSKNFDHKNLTDIYSQLNEIDRLLKTGEKNPELLFDLFVSRIIN